MSGAAPSQRRGRALILVVERDPHVQALERYFLERGGFHVEFSADGREGLECARTLRPDIVISEILVPGMDGLSVCRAIKSDPSMQGVSVLIFSILSAEQRAIEAGADGFLLKPLDDTLLVRSVETLLAHHHRNEDDVATD